MGLIKDPILNLADKAGFVVTIHEPERLDWGMFAKAGPGILLFYFFACSLLMIAAKTSSSNTRVVWAVTIISILMYYPVWHGQTGLQTIDVVLPCVAFIGSLNIIDILFVKSTKERAGWGFIEYWCHLLTLPVDEPSGKNGRVVALKRSIFVFGKLALNTLIMYTVPPPHQFAQLHGWKYFAYSGLAGLAIYALLGGVIEGVFVFTSILTGIEMKPMFENPLMAGSIREFWARWNIAIKQGFHRAIFTLSMKRKEAAAANGLRVTSKKPRNKPKGPMARVKHNDGLSETEAPTSANDTDTDGEAPRKHSFKQGGSLRGMTPMTEGKRQA